jgi:hypothetical protein
MYTFVDFTSQIVGRRGVPCPTNKGSHTPIWCAGLTVTLKIDYYYYYYYYYYMYHINVMKYNNIKTILNYIFITILKHTQLHNL